MAAIRAAARAAAPLGQRALFAVTGRQGPVASIPAIAWGAACPGSVWVGGNPGASASMCLGSMRASSTLVGAQRGMPEVDAVLAQLARSSRGDKIEEIESIEVPSAPEATDPTAAAAEGARLAARREAVVAALATAGDTAAKWIEGSPRADVFAAVAQCLDESGQVAPGRADDLATAFAAVPSDELLAAEIFTPGQLAASVRAVTAKVEAASCDDVADVSGDADTAAELLLRAGDAVAAMALDETGLPLDRSDVLSVQGMVSELSPAQQLLYTLPVGGVDVVRFVADALPFASATRELGTALQALPAALAGNGTAEGEAVAEAWKAAPAGIKPAMPAAALVANEFTNVVLTKQLQAALDTVALEEEWRIDGDVTLNSVPNDDVRTVLENGVFIKTIEFDDDGRIASASARQSVEQLMLHLPPRLRDQFSSADELAHALLEVYRIADAKKKPFPEADHQYRQWVRLYGADTAVPLEQAHGFFVHGRPLVAPEQAKREEAYLYPDMYHKPEDGGVFEAPRQGSLFEASETSGNEPEWEMLMSSPAMYTSRIVFNEILIWLERMQDVLETVKEPSTLLPDEEPEDLEKRRLVFDEKVAFGRDFPVPTWMSREEMSAKAGGELSIAEHRILMSLLSDLWKHPYGGLIHAKISMFSRQAGKTKVEVQRSGVDQFGRAMALGRRKNSQAKVLVSPGSGVITVNDVPLTEYFHKPTDRYEIVKPLLLAGFLESVDVQCSARGGGHTGQAGACRLAISRAIADLHPEIRPVLKKALFLRRDARVVERKKPGQKKARKKFQWVKR
mmetsp:Transcript_3828/g.9665  ORF Transcript_3828/g.9665 Transcript_3828/m.9665 type:complete len:796 (-) Transcript_3828:879-3266(-)